MKKRVLLGMSGGVDSSVAALLLRDEGYEVVGVTMKLRPDAYMSESAAGGCCSLDDIDNARRVAYKLGIEHLVLNFTEVFEREVIGYFAAEYAAGRTPNPCIACNQRVQFEALLQRALALGFDFIATGHYALRDYDPTNERWLLRRAPCAKDQSYVLYGMTQHQLAHTLFPLGGMEKEAARALAAAHDLPVAHKPDSQEICFVEDNDYAGFLERYTGKIPPPGDFVDADGNVLGRHRGITRYTIGQRKGLGIAFGRPMYVTRIDPERNTVTLREEGGQYAAALRAGNLNFIPFDRLTGERRVQAKVRYQARPAAARLLPLEGECVRVEFDEPQRSVTPGQAVVFYDGDLVLGGGTIQPE